jgi:hypothetical protein
MREQSGGEQGPELDPRIKAYFRARRPPLDPNDIPPQTLEALRKWPTEEVDELVKVLTVIGISLEHDAPLNEGESLESGKPTTPLGKYRFVIH